MIVARYTEGGDSEIIALYGDYIVKFWVDNVFPLNPHVFSVRRLIDPDSDDYKTLSLRRVKRHFEDLARRDLENSRGYVFTLNDYRAFREIWVNACANCKSKTEHESPAMRALRLFMEVTDPSRFNASRINADGSISHPFIIDDL